MTESTKHQDIREANFQQVLDMLHTIFVAKDKDYGASTTKGYQEFGMQYYNVILFNKLNRLKTLSKSNNISVNEEPIRDTLLDMANYCILAYLDACEADNIKIEASATYQNIVQSKLYHDPSLRPERPLDGYQKALDVVKANLGTSSTEGIMD